MDKKISRQLTKRRTSKPNSRKINPETGLPRADVHFYGEQNGSDYWSINAAIPGNLMSQLWDLIFRVRKDRDLREAVEEALRDLVAKYQQDLIEAGTRLAERLVKDAITGKASVSVTPEIYARLNAEAMDRGVSPSDYLTELITAKRN